MTSREELKPTTAWNANDWHLFLCQHCDNRATSPNGLNTVALKIASAIEDMRASAQEVNKLIGAELFRASVKANAQPSQLAPGCCSAISPCSHQRNDPTTICDTCKAAATLALPPQGRGERKMPVLVPDRNSASGHRVEYLNVEVDADLAKELDEGLPTADDVRGILPRSQGRDRAELSQATGNSETFEETRRQVVKAREKRLAELVEENAALRSSVEQAKEVRGSIPTEAMAALRAWFKCPTEDRPSAEALGRRLAAIASDDRK